VLAVFGSSVHPTRSAQRVCNTTGYGLFGAAEELGDDQVVHQLATNLSGPIQLIRAALPHLRAQGGGRIIGLSTYGGQAALPGGSLYHASKWGLEGFLDSIAQELAPFKIGVSIVEPGGARTNFRFGGAQLGTQLEAYKGTPAAMVHTMIKDMSRLPPGDPAKMAKVIIGSVDQNPAPKRIALGSDAYSAIHKALTDRLSALEAKREVAFSTDFPKDEQRASSLRETGQTNLKEILLCQKYGW
jgi:NAD(P)-dependent dehydrogenase (short-subunit alcohol dehydrogenase family)